MRADLHAHTWFSRDSTNSPEAFVKAAIKRGLDAIAVTDHNSCAAWSPVKKLAGRKLRIVQGIEIETVRDGTKRGEILGLFLTDPVTTKQLDEAIDQIKGQGGLFVVPHPFDTAAIILNPAKFANPRKRLLCLDDVVAEVDAIEAFNSHSLRESYGQKAQRYASDHRLGITAGSDAHHHWEIGNAYAIADCDDLEGLRQVILKRKTRFEGRRSHVFIGAIACGLAPLLPRKQ